MKLSIVIPTCGRTKELDNLLKSIECYVSPSMPNFEVLVINQNYGGLIDDIIQKHSANIFITNCKVDFRGLSKAKNYGSNKASGDIVCFIDDDAEFLPGSIDIVFNTFRTSEIDIISGRCVDRNGNNSVIQFDNNKSILTIDSFDGKFIESTMFFKSSLLRKYQYDENMGVGAFYGAEEGYDIVYRMLKDGVKILFDPNVRLYHPQTITDYSSSKAIRRSFTYRCGFGYLCKKHKFASKYWKRVLGVMLYIPFLLVIKPEKVRFYLAELLGLIAGKLL